MTKILIAFGSEEGQTAKISRHAAECLRAEGVTVDLLDCRSVPGEFILQGYDGVMLGASIHLGRHQRYVIDFVQLYRTELEQIPSAFFTVCLTAKSHEPDDQQQVVQYLDDFVDATAWRADLVGVFAGALPYSQYGPIKRLIIKRISLDAGGDADNLRDYEYTDWISVDAFVQEFGQRVADIKAQSAA